MDRLIKNFLLADDDDDDTELFCDALAEIDPSIQCISVRDGKQVLEELTSLEHNLPDIIFLDVNMPGMNGWECVVKIKSIEAYRSIPVIMYSTSSLQRDADLALELGAASFYVKPSDYKQLKTLLRTITTSTQKTVLDTISELPGITSKKTTATS